jgi:hypothetical protein
MKTDLEDVLNKIGESFKNDIMKESNCYLEVDIGKQATELGLSDIQKSYEHVNAIVPLKQSLPGMKVMIDGRSFTNYAQFDTGIAVPAYVARETMMNYQTYIPADSMILNFA